ncbi:putative DNA-binding protein [Gramella sp. Hel_I_59]|uniref:AlbA family DNA-binding domain-containing protein n=1 Tax=Gramella sp. Hel_I_59 TaxID=1249978 RepID=UPI00114DADC9|nr:ATP-binding protein [Gramella sp. Hel_I_59]TQI71158.1 putative DNA-binding protein [Gramella sp. Hel_I_59]
MSDEIEKIIDYESESHKLDFKEIEYSLGNNPKKNEILKDFSALANHPSNDEKLIIIGVIEENGLAKDFRNIDKVTDEAKYQQFIESNIEPKINFEYKSFNYKDYKLTYFRIFNNQNRPYLFKKELKRSTDKKVEFRAGDGYIRMGTSTRKLIRKDFDSIYNDKVKAKDRKSDLEINYETFNYDMDLEGHPVLEVHISNVSNKSIDIDIELRIKRDLKSYKISERSEILRKIEEKKYEGSSFGFGLHTQILPSLDITFEEKWDYYVIKMNPKTKKFPITLFQNQKEEEIFQKEIVVDFCEIDEIIADLIIRSDDFLEGPLKQELKFSI